MRGDCSVAHGFTACAGPIALHGEKPRSMTRNYPKKYRKLILTKMCTTDFLERCLQEALECRKLTITFIITINL